MLTLGGTPNFFSSFFMSQSVVSVWWLGLAPVHSASHATGAATAPGDACIASHMPGPHLVAETMSNPSGVCGSEVSPRGSTGAGGCGNRVQRGA